MGFWSVCAAAVLLQAQSGDHPRPFSLRTVLQQKYADLNIGGGQTLAPFLGDKDPRVDGIAGITWAKPERHLRLWHKHGMLIQELYYEHSTSHHGGPPYGSTPSSYEAFGYLIGARYLFPWGSYAVTIDAGWGAQYNTHRTFDLPSRLNSTPFLDVDFWIPNGQNPVFIGVRYLHSSNAHTVGTNQGQNQVFGEVGVKF